jgi:hypothetical protein
MIPTTAGGEIEGPCEPTLVQLQDGRILTVFRVGSFKGHWAALSSDAGRHWSVPFATGTWAVSPSLFQLKSGVVVLTSGRPSIGLWLTSHHSFAGSRPQAWEFHNVIKVGNRATATLRKSIVSLLFNLLTHAQAHNAQVTNPADRYPDLDAAVQNASSPHYNSATTAYTGLTSLDDETLLISYDRLANGWEGPPGKLGGCDKVFTMAVKIASKGGNLV